jgi:hypothetical protein
MYGTTCDPILNLQSMILKCVDACEKKVVAPSARLLMTQNNERNEAYLAGTGNATEVLLFGHVAFVVNFAYD